MKRQCSVPGCHYTAFGSFCKTPDCYTHRRAGIPDSQEYRERLRGYLLDYRNIVGDCWNWTRGTNKAGYGIFRPALLGVTHSHRLAYILWSGPIVNDLCVLHKCDNRICFNPAHLFLGTKMDNTHDALSKGRLPFGERSYTAVLTDKDVIDIRNSSELLRVLAARYGVCESTISKVKRGARWKHLPRLEPLTTPLAEVPKDYADLIP